MSIQDPANWPRHSLSLACPHCHFEAIGKGATQPSALNNGVFNIVAHALSIHAPRAQQLETCNSALTDALHEIDMLRAQLDEHEPQHMAGGGDVIDIEGALKQLGERTHNLELWSVVTIGRLNDLDKLASRVNELELAAEEAAGNSPQAVTLPDKLVALSDELARVYEGARKELTAAHLRGGDLILLDHPIKAPFLEMRDSLRGMASEINAGKWESEP